MREEIAKIAEQIIHEAQDDYAVNKKHMPSQSIRALELTNTILALEVVGKLKCTYKSQCNFNRGGICYKTESRRWSTNKCEDQRNATIGDIIGA